MFEAVFKTLLDIPYASVAPNLMSARDPVRSRGRLARIEAKTDAQRARTYRRNRNDRTRIQARICRDLLRADAEAAARVADLALVRSFLARVLPELAREWHDLAAASTDTAEGGTRSQRYRSRLARERAAVDALLRAHAEGRLDIGDTP
jgi:hypothetical protein